MNRDGGAAPTGCYKCGRPGHWSRDCPSNPPNNNSPTTLPPNPRSSKPKQKGQRKSRPKLTPDLLISDGTGIGYILRYFPHAFKFRGRDHEVNDLKHLLCMYAEWHSRLLSYHNFDQFIHKVEQVGATKRVKMCLRELRDRVADGVDPMKLQEAQLQNNSTVEDAPGSSGMPSHFQEHDFPNDDRENNLQDMSHGNCGKANEETPTLVESINTFAKSISEEQRDRMEANRLKALERAAARKRRDPTL